MEEVLSRIYAQIVPDKVCCWTMSCMSPQEIFDAVKNFSKETGG